jgi:DNA replication regulator DPB11
MCVFSGSMLFRNECDEWERRRYRTECWLERCIYEERICSPAEHVSFVPLKIGTPVAGSIFFAEFHWASCIDICA